MEDTTNDIINAQKGDKDALATLVENNQGLIWSVVKRFLGRGYETEDIYQIGSLGFVKAIRKFDIEYDVKLSTYAIPYIMGEIKRFLRDDGPIKISRSLKDLQRKVLEIQKEYLSKEGRNPTLGEISKLLKTSKEEITLALESSLPINSIEESLYSDNKSNNSLRAQFTLCSAANLYNSTDLFMSFSTPLPSRYAWLILAIDHGSFLSKFGAITFIISS